MKPKREWKDSDTQMPWTSMEDAWFAPFSTRQQDRLAAMNKAYLESSEDVFRRLLRWEIV